MTIALTEEPSVGAPNWPSRTEILAAIPDHCSQRSLPRSLAHAAISVALTVLAGLVGLFVIPLDWEWAPIWILYAIVTGTIGTGMWVIAHECGHRAFADGTRIQDSIGFLFHSALLVPYFSWQRSHAVHHANTNHLTAGETHVPKRADSVAGRRSQLAQRRFGRTIHGGLTVFGRLFAGWPLYLAAGATGGPERGTTNHFWPYRPFSRALYPGRWPRKVLLSAAGVAVTLGMLLWWGFAVGSAAPVVAVYGGPYLVCNMWLVGYTWLQHTDVDVPHYDDDEWTFVRGAFSSVDRPYGPVIDFLHHRIGSTHVAHHVNSRIPHYHAAEATTALATSFPDLYRYDPTPLPSALWRVASRCHVVSRDSTGAWRF